MLRCVALLLEAGANPNHRCEPIGHSALHLVCEFCEVEHLWITRLLIAHGAKLENETAHWEVIFFFHML